MIRNDSQFTHYMAYLKNFFLHFKDRTDYLRVFIVR